MFLQTLLKTLPGASRAKRKRNGFTAIEYAAIAALIAGGITLTLYTVGANNDKKKYQQFLSDNALMMQGLHDFYQGNYGTATIAAGAAGSLITAGAVPTSVSKGSTTTLTNAFGGGVAFTGATLQGQLLEDGIPQSWCENFLVSAPVSTSFVGVQVASGTTGTPGAFTPATPATPPISQANAGTYCAQSSNVIQITFR